jgi:hypothetical protein
MPSRVHLETASGTSEPIPPLAGYRKRRPSCRRATLPWHAHRNAAPAQAKAGQPTARAERQPQAPPSPTEVSRVIWHPTRARRAFSCVTARRPLFRAVDCHGVATAPRPPPKQTPSGVHLLCAAASDAPHPTPRKLRHLRDDAIRPSLVKHRQPSPPARPGARPAACRPSPRPRMRVPRPCTSHRTRPTRRRTPPARRTQWGRGSGR